MKKMDEIKNTKAIFSARTARQLLRLGNTIIDIKPNKENKEKTVFIFRFDDKFKEDLLTLARMREIIGVDSE